MGRSCFLKILLVSALLLLSFSQGFSRPMMGTVEYGDSSVQLEETERVSRVTIEVMDYQDPEPNTNPKTGFIFTPPPQP